MTVGPQAHGAEPRLNLCRQQHQQPMATAPERSIRSVAFWGWAGRLAVEGLASARPDGVATTAWARSGRATKPTSMGGGQDLDRRLGPPPRRPGTARRRLGLREVDTFAGASVLGRRSDHRRQLASVLFSSTERRAPERLRSRSDLRRRRLPTRSKHRADVICGRYADDMRTATRTASASAEVNITGLGAMNCSSTRTSEGNHRLQSPRLCAR